ncbi:MAG: hypothetical protein EBV06_11585 [Planctomycetia bacterium]|nr:hypothetical protein [Planctomycetia bacterium]
MIGSRAGGTLPALDVKTDRKRKLHTTTGGTVFMKSPQSGRVLLRFVTDKQAETKRRLPLNDSDSTIVREHPH